MDLTADELRAHKDEGIAIQDVTAIAAYIQEKAKWKLGLPEDTLWKPHYGCDTPEVMKRLADRMGMKTKDGKAMLLDSDGRYEAEFFDAERSAIWLELPGEVIKLKGNFLEIVEGIRQINDVLQEVKTSLQTTTEIEGILASRPAQEVIERVKRLKKDQAAPEAVARSESDGVMYQ